MTHTQSLQTISDWKVKVKLPLAESCLCFSLLFLSNPCGCEMIVQLCAGVFCFALAFLKVTLQHNRSTEIYVSLLFIEVS